MSDSERDGIFERTKHSLQLLACPADVQIRLLPPFVHVTDELALDFNHWQSCMVGNYDSELTPEQIASLVAIDSKFSLLSRGEKEFWTEEALAESQDWENIRQMAVRALGLFGWPVEIPPGYQHEFFEARPDSGPASG